MARVGLMASGHRPDWFDQPVLVTGATGMIGSHLCRRLVDAGVPVVALVLDDDPRSELRRSGTWGALTVVNGALEDLRCVERAVVVHDVATVFHLGAQTLVGAARRDPVATFEANVRGTWNVLDVARRHADLVQRTVVASSDKAYGASATLPYDEDDPLGGVQPYEASKACADIVARSFAGSYDLPVGVARCGNVYGPGDLNWSRLVPGTTRALLEGEQPVIRSDGSLVRDYLHVSDAVGGYLALADALSSPLADRDGPGGIAFNFSDEAPRTVLEVYDAICVAAGAAGTRPRIDGEASDEIPAQHLRASRARERLGWKAEVALHDGLVDTVAWYRALLAADPGSFGR
ncbi:MAG: NAD-dependent epimerase/dehydratase family protein [Acidimicrobiales bacterium]